MDTVLGVVELVTVVVCALGLSAIAEELVLHLSGIDVREHARRRARRDERMSVYLG